MDDDIARIQTRLAQRLISLRTERGWTLEVLEAHTGVSRSTLSRFERAETGPTVVSLAKVCAAYGRSMSSLLADVEAPAVTDKA